MRVFYSDCRFEILAKNYQLKVPFFFQYSNWKIVKIRVKGKNNPNFGQMNKFDLILTFDLSFKGVPIGISKKERYFQ